VFVRIATRALVAALAVLSAWARVDADQSATPPALRAAFVYNFAKFAEWPEDAPAGNLIMCVLADSAVADALEQVVAGRPIGGREATVTRIAPGRVLRSCHLVYFGDVDAKLVAQALGEVKGAPVLTVSNGDHFVRAGGVVGLLVEGTTMQFAINTEAASRARVKLSSRLLSLAKLVKGDANVQP
jgi:hypothetical protein